MARVEDIVWSEDTFAIRDFAEQYSYKLPVFVLIDKGSSGENVVDNVESGEIARIHSVMSHRRILVENEIGQFLSFPEALKFKFGVNEKSGKYKRKTLREVTKKYLLPAAVTSDKKTRWPKTYKTISNQEIQYTGKMVVIATYTEKFLKINMIKDGVIDRTVGAMPFYSQVQLRVFGGMATKQQTASWNKMKEIYSRRLSSVHHDTIRPPGEVLVFSADQIKHRMGEEIYNTLITAKNMKQEYTIAKNDLTYVDSSLEKGDRKFTMFFNPDDELEKARIIPDGNLDTLERTLHRMESSTLERMSTANTQPSESDDEVFADTGNKDVSVIRYDTEQAVDRKSSSPDSSRIQQPNNGDSPQREHLHSSTGDSREPSPKSSSISSSSSSSRPSKDIRSGSEEDVAQPAQYGTVFITPEGEDKDFGTFGNEKKSPIFHNTQQDSLHRMKTWDDLSPKAEKDGGQQSTVYTANLEIRGSDTRQQVDDTASLNSQRTATIIHLHDSPSDTDTLVQSRDNSVAAFPMRNANSVSSMSREGSIISIPIGHQQDINIAPPHQTVQSFPVAGMLVANQSQNPVLSQGASSISSVEDHTLHIEIQGTGSEWSSEKIYTRSSGTSGSTTPEIVNAMNTKAVDLQTARARDGMGDRLYATQETTGSHTRSSRPEKRRQEPVDERMQYDNANPVHSSQPEWNSSERSAQKIYTRSSGTSRSTTPDIISAMNAMADDLQKARGIPDKGDRLDERQEATGSHSQSTRPEKRRQERVDERMQYDNTIQVHSRPPERSSDPYGSTQRLDEQRDQDRQPRQKSRPRQQEEAHTRGGYQDEDVIQGRMDRPVHSSQPSRYQDPHDRRNEHTRQSHRSDNYGSHPRRHDDKYGRDGYPPQDRIDRRMEQPVHNSLPKRDADPYGPPDQRGYDFVPQRHEEQAQYIQPERFPDPGPYGPGGLDYVDQVAPRRATNRRQYSHPDNYENLIPHSRSNSVDPHNPYHQYDRLQAPYDPKSVPNNRSPRHNRHDDDRLMYSSSSQLSIPIYDSERDERYDPSRRYRNENGRPRYTSDDSRSREGYSPRSPKRHSPGRRQYDPVDEPVYASGQRNVEHSPPQYNRTRHTHDSPPRRRRTQSEEWPLSQPRRSRENEDAPRQRRSPHRSYDSYDGEPRFEDYPEERPRRQDGYRGNTSPSRTRIPQNYSRRSPEYNGNFDGQTPPVNRRNISEEGQYSPNRRHAEQRPRRANQSHSSNRRRYSDDDADYRRGSITSDLSEIAMKGPLIEGVDLFDKYPSDRSAQSSLPRSSGGDRRQQVPRKSQLSDGEHQNAKFAGMSGFNKYSAMLTSNQLSPTSQSVIPISSVDRDLDFRTSSHQSRNMLTRPIVVQPEVHGGSTNFSNTQRHMYQKTAEPRYHNRSRYISTESDNTCPATSRYEYSMHDFSRLDTTTKKEDSTHQLDKYPDYKEPQKNVRDIQMRSSTSSDSSSQSGSSGFHAVYDLEKRRNNEPSRVDSEVFDLTHQADNSSDPKKEPAQEQAVMNSIEAINHNEQTVTQGRPQNGESQSLEDNTNESMCDTSISSIIASSKAEALEELDKMTRGEPQRSGYSHSSSIRSLNVSTHSATDVIVQESSEERATRELIKSGSVSSLRHVMKTPASSLRLAEPSHSTAQQGGSRTSSRTQLQDLFTEPRQQTATSSGGGGKFVMRFREGDGSAF